MCSTAVEQLIAYYFMRHTGKPAPEQCEGCTWVTSQIAELSYIHSRDVTYATICQSPYEEGARYRDFMAWEMPWHSAQGSSLDALLTGRREAGCTSFATCDKDPRSSRLTGRQVAVLK